jgi:hypothetical protein
MAASRFTWLALLALGVLGLASRRFDMSSPVVPPGSFAGKDAGKPAGDRVSGPERERRFFDDWHGDDYGAVLPPEKLNEMNAAVAALETGEDQLLGGSGWSLMGPSGMQTTTPSTLYSGRILDIDGQTAGDGHLHFWFAAASGGLWDYDATIQAYTPLTESLPTQVVGTVSVDPANAQNIVIGTGEYALRAGLGIFRTTNGGATWTAATGDGTFAVHRIRHITSTRLVAAAEDGFYLSIDGGATWTQRYAGTYFDLAMHPTSTDTLYTTAIYNDSTGVIWRSTDGGATFNGGVTVANARRGAVSLCASKPYVVYAAFAKPDPTNALSAIVKTTNGGGSWFGLPPGSNHLGGQGWYDNTISVDPGNAQIVYVGGVYLKQSTNGGSTWTDLAYDPPSGLHADFHALEWVELAPGGFKLLLAGHDGGWSYRTGGVFVAPENDVPITQYTHIHAAQNNRLVVAGGSQDNGISVTTDGGTTWRFSSGGDGGAISIDPNDPNRMWAAIGVFDGPVAFGRYRSTDAGVSPWTLLTTGIDTALTWYPDFENDQVAPVYIYNSADRKLLKSTDYGDNWSVFATYSANILALKVGRYQGGRDAAIWTTHDKSTFGSRLWVYDTGVFHNREVGLPDNVTFRAVIPHPVEPNTAFVLVNGFDAPTQKLWRTLDRGVTWTNITGNLPNVPLASIVAHPTNPDLAYLGTEAGCFRGWQSGGNWYWTRWNQGMPDAVIVTDLTWVNELSTTGAFFIIAGTYGRSIYQREVQDIDVSAVPPELLNPPRMTLAQSAPNPVPVGAAARIAFTLPKAGTVSLRVYDVSGRLVATLADGRLAEGRHEHVFETSGVAAGAYFYRLEAGGAVLSKKLIVR